MSSYQDDRYGQGSEEVAAGLLQEDPEMYDRGAANYGFDLDAQEPQGGEDPWEWEGESQALAPQFSNPEQLCICGVVRSEHKQHGCRDGFITPTVWARLHVIIAKEVLTCQK